MKIIEYRTVVHMSLPSLAVLVNQTIKEGWEPFGDLLYAERAFVQTMVKYNEDSWNAKREPKRETVE